MSDPEKKTLNLGKHKVTDWVQNARVILPDATHPFDEAELQVRKDNFT